MVALDRKDSILIAQITFQRQKLFERLEEIGFYGKEKGKEKKLSEVQISLLIERLPEGKYSFEFLTIEGLQQFQENAPKYLESVKYIETVKKPDLKAGMNLISN